MSETATVLTVAVGVFAAACGVPVLWHGGMGLVYAGLAATQLGSGTAPDPVGLALLAFFGVTKLGAALVLGTAGLYAAVATARALRGDDAMLVRAAGWGAAAALLVVVGDTLSCDCLGGAAATVTGAVGAVATTVALRRARELRDTPS